MQACDPSYAGGRGRKIMVPGFGKKLEIQSEKQLKAEKGWGEHS
jgi:hypothetical protein